MPAATSLHASVFRLDTTTLAPCSARRSAIALPMPFVEPVTSATFPVRSNSVIAILYQRCPGRWGSAARRRVPGDLDQVAVGVAAVDRRHRPERASALDRSGLEAYLAGLEMRDHLLGRVLGDEAQVIAARDRVSAGEPGHRVGIDRAEVDL